jgi:hypothetical protein
VIEAETPRLHDLSNTDPDASLDLINRSKLRVERLEIAIPKLRNRIKAIELFEYTQAWHASIDAVKARESKSCERLKHYPKFVAWLQDEFTEIDAINAEIAQLHARAPAGEDRRLLDPELLARGLDHFDAAHPPLRENLKLPKWDRSSETAFPPDPAAELNRRAAQMNAALAKRMADRDALTTGANWAAGRDLAVQQEEAEHAKRDAELKAKETADKATFEQRLQEAERRRLVGG